MSEEEGDKKFNNCKFRSADMIERTIQRCSCQGGNYIEQGFQCEKRNIFKIAPEICYYCDFFEQK